MLLISSASIGGVITAIATYLVANGAVVFRWGTVSFAFYLASWGTVCLCMSVVLGVPNRWGQVLSLEGLRSLAAVPIHYMLIAFTLTVIGSGSAIAYLVITLILTICTIAGSVAIPWAACLAAAAPTVTHLVIGIIVMIGWAVILFGELSAFWDAAVRGTAQLAVCLIFALQAIASSRPAPINFYTKRV
jgi:hypothetical protein